MTRTLWNTLQLCVLYAAWLWILIKAVDLAVA
jgi:hypothetical protein